MEPLSRLRRIRVLALGAVLGLATLAGVLASRGSAVAPGPTFAPPVYVDQQLAGGEPEVFADTKHGTLIYTAHEGTTHLYRDGIVSSPWGDFSFVTNYCNQVNVWTSSDGGVNWFRDRYLGSPCPTSPAENTGFSDPDLTQDAGGRVYDKLKPTVVEPAIFQHPDGSFGLGISTMPEGGSSFTPHEGVRGTSMYAHWPAIAIDSAGTIYLTWDTDNRQAGTSGGCNGSETPAPNSIKLIYTKDLGKTWSAPRTITQPGTRVLWPWIAAGDAGNVSVIWYQTEPQDGQPDLDCQTGHIHAMEASLLGANGNQPQQWIADAPGRVIHIGWVCQGGTTCVATGQDRRLGDYFTNALDARGCVLIATGDTRLTDPTTGGPLPTARPLFIRQNGGPRLIGNGTCS